MSPLYKRFNIWWVYVTIDGIRQCRSTGLTNKKMAEAFERKYREELVAKAAGLTDLDPEMTFSDLAARFLASAEVKPHHIDRLKMLLPYWEDRTLRSITRGSVKDYRAVRMRARKLTDTTLNRDVEVLRHILFWAVEEGILAQNPIAGLRMPRARKRRRPILSWYDEQTLLHASSPHLARIIVTALDTGLRRGEITRQLWEDIDLNRGVLSVTHSKTPEGEQREIPLTDRMRSVLAPGKQTSGPVFTFKGEAITRIKTAWAGAIRRAGIPRFRFHDLRHTFNTRLLELGVQTDVRKALMGHSSGEDVHSIYTHVEMPLKRQAIDKLNAWMHEQMQSSQPEVHRVTRDYTDRSEAGDSCAAV